MRDTRAVGDNLGQNIYVRLTDKMREEVDNHLEIMRGEVPTGVELHRATAIRALLAIGLEVATERRASRKGASRKGAR